MRSELKLTQQLVMTPQLQMAIKLLQLSRLELVETIRQELNENPVLEESYETRPDEDNANLHGEEPVPSTADQNLIDNITPEVKIEEHMDKDIDWDSYIEEYNTPSSYNLEHEVSEGPQYETFIAETASLDEHLLWQFVMQNDNPADETVAQLIIGHLDSDGYLSVSDEELAEIAGVTSAKIAAIVALMQTFDPVGICARNLQECLKIQAVNFGFGDTVVTDIIDNHLQALENRDLRPLAKSMKKSVEEIQAAVEVIRHFDPKPAHQFNHEIPQYITPDIYVHKVDGEFVVLMNDDGIPRLRINPLYRESIVKKKKLPGEAEDYLQDKMRSAAWLIRSIHQRQKTIFRVMESIVRLQHDFFENGIDYLKPLVLRDVAEDLELHESTVSRVTTNKYAYTPQGIFELKFFFTSAVKSSGGGDAMSSVSVMERIRKIIADEDKRKPLSDDAIVKILNEKGCDIARRTVAKYREQLRILPSSKRKQYL